MQSLDVEKQTAIEQVILNKLQSKCTLFTDFFNVYKLKLPPSSKLHSYQFIIFNAADRYIFSTWFNCVAGKSEDTPANTAQIYVNPPTAQHNAGCIFTVPKEGIHSSIVVAPLNPLIVQSSPLTDSSLRYQKLTFSFVGYNPGQNKFFENTIFVINSLILPANSFKLLLQMLMIAAVKIDKSLFEYVGKEVKNYLQYRRIELITDNTETPLNTQCMYNEKRVPNNRYTRNGIPLNLFERGQ